MSTHKRNRTLFILDEPSTGLHFNDILQLADCFILYWPWILPSVWSIIFAHEGGHYIIDIGPGAADEGEIVARTATPEEFRIEASRKLSM